MRRLEKLAEEHEVSRRKLNRLEILRSELKGDSKISQSDQELVAELCTPFVSSFSRFSFPVVYLADDEDGYKTSLGNYHFGPDGHRDPHFFDLKSLSRNSPTLIVIAVAATVMLPLLAKTLKTIFDLRKSYWEGEKAKAEVRKLTFENELSKRHASTDGIDSEIEHALELNITRTRYFEERLEKIDSHFFKDQLRMLNKSISDQLEWTLRDYRFTIAAIEVMDQPANI